MKTVAMLIFYRITPLLQVELLRLITQTSGLRLILIIRSFYNKSSILFPSFLLHPFAKSPLFSFLIVCVSLSVCVCVCVCVGAACN